ncbi:MAG: Grx4 family monothiol glutaredoxin [Lentisphaeria bacterium]|nr:Grx4 family monothiol glutaredoxin [Lentisphaeria bacterium]MDP7740943.1 Grx4 family monothiol glutaredoxin [Lentisphaeria bacterium]
MAVQERIQKLVDDNKVMLFMKGTPEQPMCGFSSTVIEILKRLDIEYGSANVLDADADSELRDGIKAFSDWPTLPQLYVNGEFVGGCDLAIELYQSGELEKMIVGEGTE